MGALSAAEITLSVLEARGLSSRRQQGWSFWGLSWTVCPRPLSQLLVAPAVLLSLARRHVTSLSALVVLWLSPCVCVQMSFPILL